jgi:hypothetical protein
MAGSAISRRPFGGRCAAIALNTFREAVRDRVLYNLVLFVLLLIAGAIFLGELSGGQESKIIVDLGLSTMLLFGVFHFIICGSRIGLQGDRASHRLRDLCEASESR